MSAFISASNNAYSTSRLSFEHFDKEFDFGIENEAGQRVKKRKRPGRKPNPPSIQEKRAQNRVAQKSYREREQQRKLEKEAERQEYSRIIKELQNKLAIAEYETKHLKACVLHLSLHCLKHHGSMPQAYAESRNISTDHQTFKASDNDERKRNPALLDVYIKDNHIIDKEKALQALDNFPTALNTQSKAAITPSCHLFNVTGFTVHTLNTNSQDPKKIFPLNKQPSSDEASTSLPQRKQSPKNNNQPKQTESLQHLIFLRAPDMPQALNIDQPSLFDLSASSMHQEEQDQGKSSFTQPFFPQSFNMQQENLPPKNHISSELITMQPEPLRGVIFDPPGLRTAEDFAHMPTMQALHIMRLQLNLGSILGIFITASLLPTALQKIIPHDHRIDYIPSASIRDRMILFQDYFDIDDCFELLTAKTVFMGGDVRTGRNWVTTPQYSLKYWFVSHMLLEQAYDRFGVDEEAAKAISKKYRPN